MVELKKVKLICGSSPIKKQVPLPLSIRLPPEFPRIVQPPVINILKKISHPQFKKEGEAQTTKHSVVPRVFLYLYIPIVCLCGSQEGHLTPLGLILQNILEITITIFALRRLPYLAAFLKWLHSKILDSLFGQLY